MIAEKRNIIIVTTTRADWGILSPLARALALRDDVSLTIAAGNMHLLEHYGNTINEIRDDGFDNVVPLALPDNITQTPEGRTAVAASTALSLASLIERVLPDTIIILGDRYEMLGAASAALIAGVPIVHLHGGEISVGAIDDSVRHAISKMASLHLTATDKASERLRQMGEEPERICRTGSIGVENAISTPLMSLGELKSSLDGFDVCPEKTFLVTFHPVTRHPDNIPAIVQIDNLLGALEDVKECNAIITFPNNDTGSETIIERIEDFARKNPRRIKVVKSLGRLRYLSAMHHVRAVVGNTSSGILEAPSTPAATLDIGPRQLGRDRATSVIHVGDDRKEIALALKKLLTAPRRTPNPSDNPYYRPGAVKLAVDAIIDTLPQLPKVKIFKDIHD